MALLGVIMIYLFALKRRYRCAEEELMQLRATEGLLIMAKNRRFLIGGVIILAALLPIIYGGSSALVYFVTPSERQGDIIGGQVFAHGRYGRSGSLQKT